MRHHRHNRQGIVLISVCMLLSVGLMYSSVMTMRTVTQRTVMDRLQDRYQALDLARGAADQLQADLFQFVSGAVSGRTGDAAVTVGWLDTLGTDRDPVPDFTPPDDESSTDLEQRLFWGSGKRENAARFVRINGLQARAWVSSVVPTGNLFERSVTIDAEAVVGGLLRRIRSTYLIGLQVSDVFRYAYFVNNYGWFNLPVMINGEVRANGTLRFSGDMSQFVINGDLYASANGALKDPLTGDPVTGEIIDEAGNPADPGQLGGWTGYWRNKRDGNPRSRPARRLLASSQPAIGGTAPELLESGKAWDSDYDPDGKGPKPKGDQRLYPGQPIAGMPYLGALKFYKRLADDFARGKTPSGVRAIDDGDGSGSYLIIRKGDYQVAIDEVYKGPDGVEGVNVWGIDDDKAPLILIGTETHPIEIHGPVVVPGDVVIAGVITGQGTIYSGRNVHIVGNVTYQDPPRWATVERDSVTGKLRESNVTDGPGADLGTVCSGTGLEGRYFPPGEEPPTRMDGQAVSCI